MKKREKTAEASWSVHEWTRVNREHLEKLHGCTVLAHPQLGVLVSSSQPGVYAALKSCVKKSVRAACRDVNVDDALFDLVAQDTAAHLEATKGKELDRRFVDPFDAPRPGALLPSGSFLPRWATESPHQQPSFSPAPHRSFNDLVIDGAGQAWRSRDRFGD